MNFFKEYSRREFGSVSTRRLRRKSPSNNKVVCPGEQFKKIDVVQRSQTPVFSSFKSDEKIKKTVCCKSKNILNSYRKLLFKRNVGRLNPRPDKYFTNMFIEKLVSVPIPERKSKVLIKKLISKAKDKSGIEFLRKHNFQKATMTEDDNDRLVFYCDPFIIEEIESVGSPIKPRYL